jgi:hypothetical protein
MQRGIGACALDKYEMLRKSRASLVKPECTLELLS